MRVVEAQGYGPMSTPAGAAFNKQPDGSSALWIAVPGVGAAAQMRLDGKTLTSTAVNGVVSALIPAAEIALPRRRWLDVIDPVEGMKTKPVPFDITAVQP